MVTLRVFFACWLIILIYINNICEGNLVAFADDCALFYEADTIEQTKYIYIYAVFFLLHCVVDLLEII